MNVLRVYCKCTNVSFLGCDCDGGCRWIEPDSYFTWKGNYYTFGPRSLRLDDSNSSSSTTVDPNGTSPTTIEGSGTTTVIDETYTGPTTRATINPDYVDREKLKKALTVTEEMKFASLDRDNSTGLSYAEVVHVLGMTSELFDSIDTNKNSQIELDEFLKTTK